MPPHDRKLPRERLDRALARLPPVERDVLLLCAIRRLTTTEAATGLGISPKTAERHLAHALLKLDRLLDRRSRAWWRFW